MPKRKNVRFESEAGTGTKKSRITRAKPDKSKSYTRWHHDGPPITDFKNVPNGWISEDLDIHEDDVASNIERCKDRIEDGIMPQWWQRKLQKYEQYQEKLDKLVKKASDDLDVSVIIRLNELEELQQELERNGDKRGLLPNVKAVIKAYRSKKLICNGLVTYWSKGKKVCDGPMEFTWSDFNSYSKKHQGHYSFWVEGLHGPGLMMAYPVQTSSSRGFIVPPRDAQFLHEIDFSLRIPSVPAMDDGIESSDGNESQGSTSAADADSDSDDLSAELKFIDDTGASVMVMYEDDIEMLENKASQVASIVGASRLNGAFGGSFVIIYQIEVNLKDQNGTYLTDWTPIQVAVVNHDRPVGCARLSGPWMRHRFFVGTSPNKKGNLYVAKNKTLFVQQVEAISQNEIDPVPANLRLPPNPPGHLFAFPRGFTRPGTAKSPHGGDSDDDIAVRYHTARESPESSSES